MEETFKIAGKTVRLTDETKQNFEGDLVITDPCYFINDTIWQKLCDLWFNEDGTATPYAESGTIYIDGKKILYTSTAHGDGEYTVIGARNIKHNTFGVDAGMMSAVLLEDFEALTNEKISPGLHALVLEFDGSITADNEGNFGGDLVVNTRTWDSAEDDDYGDGYDDDDYETETHWDNDNDDDDDDY